MSKRTWAVLAAGALFASVLSIGPASAQDVPAVPAEPNITDPVGDANYINSGNVIPTGDQTTPADAASVGDIQAAWFTHTADKVSVHIQTEAPGPATASLFYRVRIDPGTGENCLWMTATAAGAGNPGEAAAQLRDTCTDDTRTPAEFVQTEAADGTGIHTITFDRAGISYFADGASFIAPFVEVTHFLGAATAPTVDNTVPGTDYVLTAGGGSEPDPGSTPPSDGEVGNDDPNSGGPTPPPVKKGCKKGKGKKKGCKKPKVAGCAAYTPGEQGAEAETFVVKDEHTAEAPLEITIEQEMGQGGDLGVGVYDGSKHTFRNLQVDAKAAEAGLYIRYEFPVYEDHDLYVNYAGGSEAAHVGGFNAVPAGPFDGTGSGGHSEQGAEQIDGLRTADCAGYTVDFSNYLGEGGEYTVKVWLGEIQNDPAAPAE